MNVGDIILYPSSDVPTDFLRCDGAVVSRTTYADLFAVIGETYGAGNGSTTFALPDLTGRVGVGRATSYALGASGGETSHTLSEGEMASHTHSFPSHTHTATSTFKTPSLSHTISQQPAYSYTRLNSTANRGSAGIMVSSLYTGCSNASMTRSADVAITAHAATNCTMGGSVTDCNAFNTESNGSGTAHNNMMPYLALTYIIRFAPDTPPTPRMLIYNGAMPVTAQGYYLVGTKS